jgi:hypothetical protein
MKVKTVIIAILLFASASLTAFGGMKLVKTWKNPDAQPSNWQGKKVAVFARTLLVSNRAPAQKAMVRELNQRGIQGVLGDTLVPPEVEKDRDAVKRILAEAGIAGVVIMHIVDYQDETVVATAQYMAPSYSSFSSYWNYGMAANYVPAAISTKITVMVESLVYSIEQDKLLWSGTSKAVNPKEVDEVIKKLSSAVSSEVKKAGLTKK